MSAALRVEWLKLRRSRVALVATALMGVVLPAMGLAFYDVAVSGGVGPLGDKAGALLTGKGWIGYLGLVDQIAAVAVFLGAGVVVAWVFGREHVDRTFSSLFALTVSRATIAAAKFIVLTVWVIALALLIASVAFGYGVLAAVAPIEPGVVFPELIRLFAIAAGSGALSLTMGYVSSSGRGYLPAIGALIVIIAAAQVAVLFGTGGWFPFAVPGLAAIAGAEGVPDLTPLQISLVPTLAALTTLLTIRWWTRTEATRS